MGDQDLALHYLVVREAGWAAYGHQPENVIGPVHPAALIHQLGEELRWAAEEAPDSYAILNTCRAIRYAEEGVICAKTDGGVWALERGIEPSFVRRALTLFRSAQRRPLRRAPMVRSPCLRSTAALAAATALSEESAPSRRMPSGCQEVRSRSRSSLENISTIGWWSPIPFIMRSASRS